jgi:hypothetical protein
MKSTHPGTCTLGDATILALSSPALLLECYIRFIGTHDTLRLTTNHALPQMLVRISGSLVSIRVQELGW